MDADSFGDPQAVEHWFAFQRIDRSRLSGRSAKNNACYVARASLSPVMAHEKFDQPVTVVTELPGGGQETIGDATVCLDFLLRRWRGKRSEKYRAAIQACSDTNSGRRPASSARKAFIVAAREAAILVTA